MNIVNGFSKLSKQQKIDWLVAKYFSNYHTTIQLLKSYWNSHAQLQSQLDEFNDNTIHTSYLPLCIAANVVIIGKTYGVPMVTEESSVVAAAATAAKFW